MDTASAKLSSLFSRIPRRHTPDNVKEMYSILDEYEDALREIEAQPEYEKVIAPFFDDLEPVRETIKSSSLNKHSKQAKDKLFNDGSAALKDSIEGVMKLLE